jgi:hypothetical protein
LKEWNEAISNAPETPEVVEILCKKLAELEARYPVNALI